jgi:hypothetical protein
MITEVNFSFMKNIFSSLFCLAFVFIACKDHKKNMVHEKPSFDSIGKIPFEKAVVLYGNPQTVEIFDNADKGVVFPGIRAGIGEYYQSGVKIKIKEAIWLKDDSIYTAIWYTKKQNNWVPFDSFEYSKGVDF